MAAGGQAKPGAMHRQEVASRVAMRRCARGAARISAYSPRDRISCRAAARCGLVLAVVLFLGVSALAFSLLIDLNCALTG
jgi:hypothetical protein